MKKVILFFLCLFSVQLIFAQIPVQRSGSHVTVIDDYTRAGNLSGLAIYPDTLVFNGSNGLDSVGSKIYVRSGVNVGEWTREYNGFGKNYWARAGTGCQVTFYITPDSLYLVKDSCNKIIDSSVVQGVNAVPSSIGTIKTKNDITVAYSGDTATIGRLFSNALIIPGIVTWSGTGLIMDVSNPQYYFNQKFFSPASTQVTLAPADTVNPRFDVVYVDSSGNIGVITGTASASPIIPQVNPQSQLLLSAIYLATKATTPTQVTQTLVYDENVEWSTSYTGTATVNFADISNPYHLTKDIKVTGAASGMSLIFTSPSIDTVNIGDVFKFFLNTPIALQYGYSFQFFDGSTAVSAPFYINQVSYGYNPNNLNTYQNITIPLAAFTFYSPFYNQIRMTTLGANPNTLYLDYFSVQHGNYNFAPTDYSNKVDSTTISGGNEYYWVKGISHLAGSVNFTTWNLTGNSGTTSSNFIGTTDNQPLYFRINNHPSGMISDFPNYNTGLGYYAFWKNTTGTGNTYIGALSGLYSNGNGNTSLGYAALGNVGGDVTVRSANFNTAIGEGALASSTQNKNIGLGINAGSQATDSSTLYISDSTKHLYMKLDSATGTAPNVLGKDASGFWHVYQSPSGGTVNANNGLSLSGSTVQLGGTLNGFTTIISGGANNLNIQDVFSSSYSSTNFGKFTFYSDAGVSTSSYGINSTSLYHQPTAIFNVNAIDSLSSPTALQLSSDDSVGSAGIGFGVAITFNIRVGQQPSSSFKTSTKLISRWLNPNIGTYQSQYVIQGVNNGSTLADLLTINGNGQAKLNKYGSGTFTGTLANSLGVDALGNVIEINTPLITSGSGAPSTTPAKVGYEYVDTTNKKIYFATGTSSSVDWTIVN